MFQILRYINHHLDRVSNTFVLNTVNAGNKKIPILRHTTSTHAWSPRKYLPTNSQNYDSWRHSSNFTVRHANLLTVQAAAMCHCNDDVSLSIQFHSECAHDININLNVHNFCYKNIGTCNCEHTKTMHTFSRENLAHLRRTKCINACGDSNTEHKYKNHIV
jgi:hypothetical protein